MFRAVDNKLDPLNSRLTMLKISLEARHARGHSIRACNVTKHKNLYCVKDFVATKMDSLKESFLKTKVGFHSKVRFHWRGVPFTVGIPARFQSEHFFTRHASL